MRGIWKQRAMAAGRADPMYLFLYGSPASETRIQQAEDLLNVRFPHDLRAALRECDGMGETLVAAARDDTSWLLFPMIYSVERLVIENQQFRQKSMGSPSMHLAHPSTLLMFTGTGTGDFIGYDLHACSTTQAPIIFYDHERMETRTLAPSLDVFFEVWRSGHL